MISRKYIKYIVNHIIIRQNRINAYIKHTRDHKKINIIGHERV